MPAVLAEAVAVTASVVLPFLCTGWVVETRSRGSLEGHSMATDELCLAQSPPIIHAQVCAGSLLLQGSCSRLQRCGSNAAGMCKNTTYIFHGVLPAEHQLASGGEHQLQPPPNSKEWLHFAHKYTIPSTQSEAATCHTQHLPELPLLPPRVRAHPPQHPARCVHPTPHTTTPCPAYLCYWVPRPCLHWPAHPPRSW